MWTELLKIYKDGKEISKLDFNEVVDAGGSSKPMVIQLKNITSNELRDVKIYSNDSEVIFSPYYIEVMMPFSEVGITVTWKPAKTRTKVLSADIYSEARIVLRAK